ncbi:MAG: hypothetical protein PVH00_06395 [Gemmatimonadota bacterium]|jgi:hypothetical protein
MPIAGRLALLLIAVPFFVGVGVALVHLQLHYRANHVLDPVVLAAALTLAVFGALTTTAAAGVAGVPAFGGVLVWAAYVATAQRSGLFRIERVPPRRIVMAEPRSRR